MKDKPGIAPPMERLLSHFGVDLRHAQELDFGHAGWNCHSLRKPDGTEPPVYVVVATGPRGVAEVKKAIPSEDCVVLLPARNTLFLRALGKSLSVRLDGEGEHERITKILATCDISGDLMDYQMGIDKAIRDIPVSSAHFDNRGIFSNHYLKNRLWDDLNRDIAPEVEAVRAALGKTPEEALEALGWHMDDGEMAGRVCRLSGVSIVVAQKGCDLSVRTGDDVAPSYTAVAELKRSPWVVLTNGREWRLYTSRVSASTTNYMGIDTAGGDREALRYLAALFGAATHKGRKPLIDEFFDQARIKAKSLEDDLRSKVLGADGLFLHIVKGVIGHDMKKKFQPADLADAKKSALAVMYRVWFILYAESRNLLPVRDPRYSPISLRSMRAELDGYDGDPDGHGCWEALLRLFVGIRDGDPDHNLPQYNGDLFRARPAVDDILVRNRFIAPAMRALLETDGQPVDYGDLGVRHLGSIYESLLEFEVRQADRDIMLLEDDSGGARVVESKEESTYSYKKNDLYMESGAGIVSRKASASFYTPDEIVSFLVGRGLEPLLEERRKRVAVDVRRYKRNPSKQNRQACMDTMLDLQVLDPSMGSGHFLVEALNQITVWATDVLNSHPGHPLVAEIDEDRRTVVRTQADKGVTIDESLLTADVLLKRRIMKRCIFGVDLNELAVELARLSLWLDSFAIGVPLTYLNHHIRHGDSTIGEWLDHIRPPQERSMDEWLPDPTDHGAFLSRVSHSPDITVEQAFASRKNHEEYEKQTDAHRVALDMLTAFKIDPSIVPPKTKRKDAYIRRLAGPPSSDKGERAARGRADAIADKYSFFHWELEMMDAFTDKRRGFDLVVGNPPWEKPKPSKDEFFTPHDPMFRTIKTSEKKDRRAKEILKDRGVAKMHDAYLQSFRDKSAFYKTFKLQGSGDRDMWQLVLERMLELVTDGGSVSVVVPSQILGGIGSTDMRKRLLDMDIAQAYVFENRKKIFPIHSSYRFLILTMRNCGRGPDKFPAAFYLHHLSSLKGGSAELEKFTKCSKEGIRKASPVSLIIPEVSAKTAELLVKLSKYKTLGDRFDDGWQLSLSRGFDTSNDSNLFSGDRDGWPVLRGKNMHQFNHAFSTPDFTTLPSSGLECLEKKKVYRDHCRDFHECCMIAFRDVARPNDLRTIIAAILAPHKFHAHSLNSIILFKNNKIVLSREYDQKISWIVAILNSMTLDFVARAKAQMHMAPIIKSFPAPPPSELDGEIAATAARLTCGMAGGKKEFAAFAESFNIVPKDMTPAERIDATARLDALVARAYGLSKHEYAMILDSFNFGEDPSLVEAENADWSDNNVLRRFYGEVRKAAIPHFDSIAVQGGERKR